MREHERLGNVLKQSWLIRSEARLFGIRGASRLEVDGQESTGKARLFLDFTSRGLLASFAYIPSTFWQEPLVAFGGVNETYLLAREVEENSAG